MSWKPYSIAEPALEDVRRARPDVERMLVSVLDAILERYERDPDYRFIDTKLSTLTGEDFPPSGDPERDFKGKGVVYGWIQGRGLEAMAGHAEWLPACTTLTEMQQRLRIDRVRAMLAEVLESMEAIRDRNGGRLFFSMRPDGTPLRITSDGRLVPLERIPEPSNHADLFYVKGLFAAARLLGQAVKAEEAEARFRHILDDIEAGNFRSTQQAFDPKNPVGHVPGRYGHGARMIALGGLALFFEKTGDHQWLNRAEAFLRHILDRHVNRDRFKEFHELDFFEFLDEAGRPWRRPDGEVPCDPGHALEFMGFAAKVLLQMRAEGVPEQRALVDECEALLPRVFTHIFDLGFNRERQGICKTFGLVQRQPINDDMPWWSLPETIRAAMGLHVLCRDAEVKERLLEAVRDGTNAFLHRYVNPQCHLMAYQTRNAEGEPVDVIPGTPDADPGYHTGLSLIDFLEWLG